MTRGRRAAPSPSAPPSMHGYSDRINHAFAFAAKYYGAAAPVGVGMDYLAHPANVAVILARYGCEQVTIVGGILHHVLEEANPDHRPTLESGRSGTSSGPSRSRSRGMRSSPSTTGAAWSAPGSPASRST